MNRFIGIASAILLVGVLAACTATDPRLEDEPADARPRPDVDRRDSVRSW